MTTRDLTRPGYWTYGALPAYVRIGPGSLITGDQLSGPMVFRRCKSDRDPAVVIGAATTLDGVSLNLGPDGFVEIGDESSVQEAFLISERSIRIGSRVVIGWHVTIVDSDLHPLDPAQRLADTLACSPVGAGRPRPTFVSREVVIDDDAWIGPAAVILKGVHIGSGAIVEPGAVVTRDVPPATRVLGNPAERVEWR
jgi:acetyltransferase-like isoleucine patch superfamily enzyme